MEEEHPKYEYFGGESRLQRENRLHSDAMGELSVSVKQTMTIDHLQIQLSKMQIQCLEERRNYLDLVGVVEQLKLEKEDMRRKFQAALLLGKVEESSVVHFLQKNPDAVQLTDEIIKVQQDLRKLDHGKVGEGLDNPILLARQVSHLQQYLEEMKGVNLVEIFGLKTTLELTLEEREVMRDQYEDRLKAVVGRLEDTRSLMHKMTEENLKVKKELIILAQDKGKQIKKLEERLASVESGGGGCLLLKEGLGEKGILKSHHKCVPPLQAHLLEKLSRSEISVLEQGNKIKEYELKFIQMERKLGRCQEAEAATKSACSDMIRKLKTKNESLESRFSKLDERRKLDNSGFRSDITILRTLIKAIQRKLHIFMTRKFVTSWEDGEEIALTPPPERDPCNIGRIKVFPESRVKTQPDFDLRTMTEPPLTTTTRKARGARVVQPHPPNNHGHLDPRKESELQWENCEQHLKNLDVAEELRDSREEMERDKLIYELLSKVLDSAKIKVNEIEREICKQVL